MQGWCRLHIGLIWNHPPIPLHIVDDSECGCEGEQLYKKALCSARDDGRSPKHVYCVERSAKGDCELPKYGLNPLPAFQHTESTHTLRTPSHPGATQPIILLKKIE